MAVKKTLSYLDSGLRLESQMPRALTLGNGRAKSPPSEAEDRALQLAFGRLCFCIAAPILLMM